MKNFLIKYFKWIMIGLACVSFVVAIKFSGRNELAFQCSLLAVSLFTFASIVGSFIESA